MGITPLYMVLSPMSSHLLTLNHITPVHLVLQTINRPEEYFEQLQAVRFSLPKDTSSFISLGNTNSSLCRWKS